MLCVAFVYWGSPSYRKYNVFLHQIDYSPSKNSKGYMNIDQGHEHRHLVEHQMKIVQWESRVWFFN